MQGGDLILCFEYQSLCSKAMTFVSKAKMLYNRIGFVLCLLL